MKRILFLLISFSIFFYSCSKKDAVKDNNSSTDQQQQYKNEKKVETTSNSQSTSFFSIKDIGKGSNNEELVDFTWQENGKDVKLSDSKGKVILINFWATWCPPCRKELPALSDISKQLENKNFKIIGVSVDENPQALETFLKSNTLSYTVLHGPGGLLEKYMSAAGGTENVIPQSFIIDKNGKIVEYIIGGKDKKGFLELINKHL